MKGIPDLSRINTQVLITVPFVLGFIILGVLSGVNKILSETVQHILISLAEQGKEEK